MTVKSEGQLKQFLPYLGLVVLLASVVGQWYVMNYKLDELAVKSDKIDRKADTVNCLIKEVHEIPRPECK